MTNGLVVRQGLCKSALMRWDDLFQDLESMADAQEREREHEEAAELVVAERSRIQLAERVAPGDVVTVAVPGEEHHGRVEDAAQTWVLLAARSGRVLLPWSAVAWIEGAGRVRAEEGAARSVGITHVLRELADREVRVRVNAAGRIAVGQIDAVGRDHLEVALEEGGTSLVVPLSALRSLALQ